MRASTDPRDAAIKLKEAYRVLLTCHRNPDGDAIGSELAIAELAEKIGVEAVIVNRDESGFEGLTRLPILNIDHHPDNPAYGVVNYLDDESPAVGEMVWRLFGEIGVLPSPQAATNMFTALSTDTGDFRYSNATERAFRAAAEMVDAGAQPPEVANWIHNNRSLASVRLLGESLRTLRIVCDGKLALISADQASPCARCASSAMASWR